MKSFLLLLALILMPVTALAGPANFDYRAFGQMPVLEGGRIKPLDSLARVMLKRIHGGTSFGSFSPSAWLAYMFFDPDALQARMFVVNSPEAAKMLGLKDAPDHLYSFAEIAARLPERTAYLDALARKDKNALSKEEAEVVRVYNATGVFAELIGTFSLLLPLSDADGAMHGFLKWPADKPVTLFDLRKERQKLSEALKLLAKHKKEDASSKYTTQEFNLLRASSRLTLQEEIDGGNSLVRLIPPAWGGEEWLTPWGVLAASDGSPSDVRLFDAWRKLAAAYRAGDARSWDATSHALLAQSLGNVEPSGVWRLFLEYYYNALMLLPIAACCYGLGLVLLVVRRLPASRALLLLGLCLQATAIAMRMLILMRPPVSTLYESLLFVSFLVMAVSVWLGGKGRAAAMMAGAATSLMLLLASWVFAGDSDTLGVLVAVLNTNFWLATHVVCITTGYGCSLVTGAIAHIYLFRRAVQRASEEELLPLLRMLHMAAVIALCFTAIGTMLGGIWADQSWGRFWGWDPKENGAAHCAATGHDELCRAARTCQRRGNAGMDRREPAFSRIAQLWFYRRSG
jgi:ABC-type transport system involved in cytochrome c biogenesis permease subunit